MPIARVQLPDGRIARLEVPEGTTPEQVESFVFNGMKAPKEDAIDKGARSAMKPSRLERFGRGFADITEGVKQGYLSVKDMITDGNEGETYTKEKTEDLKRYEKGRGPDSGIDWMRIGGNVAATAPAMLIPGAGAATLPVRMMAGGAQGGVASGAMFTPEGESKLAQVALGGVVGAAAPAVLNAGKTVVRNLMSRSAPVVAGAPGRLAGELEIKLQQQGIDWNKLTQTVKDSLLKDAQGALDAGGTLDDAMLRNKALIESVGAKGTKASVTRNPRDWQAQKNLRGVVGVGDEIVTREQGDAAAMVDYLGKLRTQTGGKASTPIEAGESAITAIKVQDKAKERVVGELYDAYRDSGLKDAAVPEARLTAALTKIIDEVGVENVPAAVQSRLKEFGFLGGERTKNLTVQHADLFNRLLNANNPGHGPASKTISMLRGALNESLIETPGGGAPLLKAREAAAARFAEQRAGKGIEAAIDDVSPDRFVKKFVMDADARDVRAMLAELGKSSQGKQAIADVKGHVMDNLLMKATGATNLDEVIGKPFSGLKFAKALDAIAPEKLHLLFKPEEVQALRTLQKASKLLTEEVPFSDVNHSKTTAALANLLLKLGNTPLLGKIASPIIGSAKIGLDWVNDANARKQVAEALIGSAAKAAERKALPAPGKLERLAPAGFAAALGYPREGSDN